MPKPNRTAQPSDNERNETALPLRWPILGSPSLHVAATPHPALRELRGRLREAFGLRELVGALLRHAEHLSDFGRSHEFHESQVTP